jgi:signal transduction histidine kinase
MVQVLVNFLSNAIKYADGQPVVVKARAIDGDFIELGVQDTGSGLTPEQQLQVFEKFKQLDHGGTNGKGKHKGTGIGLPIAKALVEQHGGTIGVTSAPGEGCYFWARIPRQPTTKTSG